MNTENEELTYEILNQEVQALTEEYKLFYMELGSALEKIEERNLYKHDEDEYDNFNEYKRKGIRFSPSKADELRRVYRHFQHLFPSFSDIFGKKSLYRFVLNKVGWSKAREITNNKDEFSGAIDLKILTWIEILFYASLKTKKSLKKTLENYEGPELWVRIFCKIYYPELIEKQESPSKLILSATASIIKDLKFALDDSFISWIDKLVQGNEKTTRDQFIYAFDLFISVRQLQHKLIHVHQYLPSGLNYLPLYFRLEEEPLQISVSSIEDGFKQILAWSVLKPVAFQINGIDNLAQVIGVAKDTVQEWDEKGFFPELHYLAEETSHRILVGGSPNEEKQFDLNSILIGIYLKDSIDSGLTTEKAIEKALRKMKLIQDLNVTGPYLIAAEKLSKLLSNDIIVNYDAFSEFVREKAKLFTTGLYEGSQKSTGLWGDNM